MLTKGFWTHKRFMDVFIEVRAYEGKRDGMDVYTIEWFNKGQSNYYPIGEIDMIGLEPDDYKDWLMYDPVTRHAMETIPIGDSVQYSKQTGRDL